MTSIETRYDIHRFASEQFDPADYRLVGVIDTTPETHFRADDRRARKAIEAMVAEGFEYAMVHPHGQCDACGQHLRYVAVMLHIPSDGLIEIGCDCLHDKFAMAQAEVRRLMAEAKAAREAHAKLDAFLAACENNQTLAYATYAQNILVADEDNNLWLKGLFTLRDIASKCRTYGSDASEGQTRYMDKIFSILDENERKAAERRVVVEVAPEVGPAPRGRATIEGKIIKVEERFNDFGVRLVMTVLLDNGSRAWGTVPAAIVNKAEVDTRVAFTATFKENDDADLDFAWFSRPTKATTL